MRSPDLSTESTAPGAAGRAVDFLLSRQQADGTWRDYALEPGASQAWTTGVAGYCLATVAPRDPRAIAACRAAAVALDARRRPEGWGYNAATACDADTTSWVIRFLARVRGFDAVEATELLRPYFDAAGRAHTFRSRRFGSWAGAHEDVTPNAALALLAAGVPLRRLRTVRETHLRAFRPATGWRAFWWSSPQYANALSLEFLHASGGVPEGVGARLDIDSGPEASFEAAQRLTVHRALGPDAEPETAALLASQSAEGSWPGAPVLRVPSQGDGRRFTCYADEGSILTTSLVTLALGGSSAAARG